MLMPISTTRIADTMRMGRANLWFSLPPIRPMHSISGTVPRLKQSIDSAPIHQLPVERA